MQIAESVKNLLHILNVPQFDLCYLNKEKRPATRRYNKTQGVLPRARQLPREGHLLDINKPARRKGVRLFPKAC